jgi:hypothetical protein
MDPIDGVCKDGYVLIGNKCEELSGLDYLGGVLILVIALIAFLSMGGLGILMSVGAIIFKRGATTSWPPEQEHAFTGYEDRSAGSHSRAWMVSLIAAVTMFVVAVGIYAGVEPERHCKAGQKLDQNGKCVDANQTVSRPAEPAKTDKAPEKAPEKTEPAKTEDKPADK